ncbi:MAG: hypothetical protein ACFFAE_10915 [Candidatus Hodarchaeota archaeon]
MSKKNQGLNVIIHDGRKSALDVERMVEFDIHCLLGRFFPSRDIDSKSLIEQLGD